MAHECEVCGMWCYCDMDDIGGMEQPPDCPHWTQHDKEDHEDPGEDEA